MPKSESRRIFRFLHGGSHPQDYVHQASKLRLPVIGIADHNTLAGVVRAYKELENHAVEDKPKLLIGSRLVFDGRHAGYSGLSARTAPPMAGYASC